MGGNSHLEVPMALTYESGHPSYFAAISWPVIHFRFIHKPTCMKSLSDALHDFPPRYFMSHGEVIAPFTCKYWLSVQYFLDEEDIKSYSI